MPPSSSLRLPGLDAGLLDRIARSPATRTAASAAFAALALLWANSLLRGGLGLDHPSTPRIDRAPERTKDGPYPDDIYPGGKDLDTPWGRIRYYDIGPRDGKKLFLVHGISTPTPCWAPLMSELRAAGYRILCFDLFGRGYSDVPRDVPQDTAFFITQMLMVLGDVPDFDTFDLVGMSLGGAIVSHFSHYYPNRVKKLILICPAGGTPRNRLAWARRIMLSKLVPTPLTRLVLGSINILPAPSKGSVVHWQTQNHPGYKDSLISSLQCSPIFGTGPVHSSNVRAFGPRCMAIWGDADDIVPLDTRQYFGEALDVKVIPGGNHWIVLTHPKEVAGFINEFLDVGVGEGKGE